MEIDKNFQLLGNKVPQTLISRCQISEPQNLLRPMTLYLLSALAYSGNLLLSDDDILLLLLEGLRTNCLYRILSASTVNIVHCNCNNSGAVGMYL